MMLIDWLYFQMYTYCDDQIELGRRKLDAPRVYYSMRQKLTFAEYNTGSTAKAMRGVCGVV